MLMSRHDTSLDLDSSTVDVGRQTQLCHAPAYSLRKRDKRERRDVDDHLRPRTVAKDGK